MLVSWKFTFSMFIKRCLLLSETIIFLVLIKHCLFCYFGLLLY